MYTYLMASVMKMDLPFISIAFSYSFQCIYVTYADLYIYFRFVCISHSLICQERDTEDLD